MSSVIRMAQPMFGSDEIAAVVGVLQSGNLVQGAWVERFEDAVAEYLGRRHAVACASGTAALHLALMAAKIGPGDEAIVPDFTFPATANAVELVGATSVLVDVDPQSFLATADAFEAAFTERTHVILPVHLFGLSADLEHLHKLAASRRVNMIEDAAGALGSTFVDSAGQQMRVGSVGSMATLSFHPRKIITTGEGGMVVTDDGALFEQLRELRNHGARRTARGVEYIQPAPNYRMTDFQAALGAHQMIRLEAMIEKRRALAAAYRQQLERVSEVQLPREPAGYRHTYQAYVVTVDRPIDRSKVIEHLRSRGVESTIGTYALHEQPYYRDTYRLVASAFPGASAAAKQTLALPLHPGMIESDVDRVVEGLKSSLAS